MMPWTDIEVRLLEHEHRSHEIDQNYWMRHEVKSVAIDRWQWRVMNRLGGWLVAAGCRLQTHAEQARQMVRSSQIAMEANSNSTQPCP
jgi:hypothetical protein